MIATAVHSPIFEAVQRAITDLSGGFNPRNLFAANDPGYLYDLDDLSTVFLDSAGTTPASVNGLVGLVLDKSKGLALGAELLTNGDFSSGTGWTVTATAPATASISGDVFTFNSPAGEAVTATQTALTVGKWYEVRVVATAVGGGGFRLFAGTGATNEGRYDILSPGTYSVKLRANGSDGVLYISRLGTSSATIDSISVRELSGNHRYQGTTGSKPILRGTPTGGNLVTNGTFDTDTDWTKGTGWAIGSGVATKTAGTAAAISQPYSLVAGRVYRIEYTVSGATAGTCAGALFSGTQVTGPLVGTNGRRTEYLTALSGNSSFGVTSSATFNGSIDNLVIYDVSAGSVSAPYALQYDGVDDFLQTASVDFSATDKVTVCHGVRKLSDAVSGIFVELSADFNTNNAFAMIVPDSANAQNLSFGIRQPGVGYSTALASVFPIAESYVVSASADRALPTNEIEYIRKNGSAQSITRPLNQNLSGSFGNHSIYFGRRGGTSAPFNGLEFSSICIGRLLTAAEFANTERWVARKTGATL